MFYLLRTKVCIVCVKYGYICLFSNRFNRNIASLVVYRTGAIINRIFGFFMFGMINYIRFNFYVICRIIRCWTKRIGFFCVSA